MTQYKIWQNYQYEPWYDEIKNHLELRYQAIENRMIQTFDYTTPSNSNKLTYSYVFSSILRDVGSVFDSVVSELISNTQSDCKNNIYGFLQFLESIDPELEKRSVYLLSNRKTVVPYRKGPEGLPKWWHAYNDVKHDETTYYHQGNLENALTSLAALVILARSVCHMSVATRIFTNIGIVYSPDSIDLSTQRLLFFNDPEEKQEP